MKPNRKPAASAAVLFSMFAIVPCALAVNPIVQTLYTADPAALVSKDTVYLYTGHDEDNSRGFTMKDWRVYSSKDMVNWTDHGSPLSIRSFSWVKDSAWAGHTIERKGRFYWYVPVQQRNGSMAIGVAVSDSPTGPFTDPLGKPLVAHGFGDIDPAAFIDDNGQAYLVWGNPAYKYVKLNEDMVSYDKSGGDNGVYLPTMTIEAFGKRPGNNPPERLTSYEEAPWLYKRNGLYYLFHAGGPVPENLAYSTGKTAEGPWKYGGVFMPTQGGSFTNHPAVIDFKGKTYLFYHNGGLPGGGGFTRSVCVEELKFNPDGSVVKLDMTREGPAPAATLDPYTRNEAETIAWTASITPEPGKQGGVETEPSSQGGMAVTDIENDDYIEVKNIDFGAPGAGTFAASVSCETQARSAKPGAIELRLDSVTGPLIGTLPVTYTEGQWKTATTAIAGAAGVHSLFLVFKGEPLKGLFKFDHWRFSKKATTPTLAAIQTTVDRYKLDLTAPANRTNLMVTAIFSDGSSKDVTTKARIEPEKPGTASVAEGIVTAAAPGVTKLRVGYEDKTDSLTILVKELKTEFMAKKLTASISSARLVNGSNQSFTVTAEYLDGHIEDVTGRAIYQTANADIATVEKGVIITRGKGTTTVRASFKGEFGDAVFAPINVTVSNRDPFVENKFTEFNEQRGLVAEDCSEGGQNLCDANHGEWLRVNALDFGQGAKALEVRVASANNGGTLEVRLDSPDGPLVGSCMTEGTGGWQRWVTKTCELKNLTGKHDVFFKFAGGPGVLFNVNWWKFVK